VRRLRTGPAEETSMAQQRKGAPAPEPAADAVERAPLEPIGSVRRELVRPDGTKIVVDVPVYPPFRLEGGEKAPPRPSARRLRSGPRPRRTGG
jgi:hypothetical protein